MNRSVERCRYSDRFSEPGPPIGTTARTDEEERTDELTERNSPLMNLSPNATPAGGQPDSPLSLLASSQDAHVRSVR